MEIKESINQACHFKNITLSQCQVKMAYQHLNCILPWLNETNSVKRICSTAEDLEKFLEMDLKNCTPKCRQIEWKAVTNYEVRNLINHKEAVLRKFGDTYSVNFFINQKEVKIIKEVYLYDFFNFVADFGGYLGLLLGGSILTAFDGITDISKYFLEKKKCNK